MKYDLVLFDFDGTLMNTSPGIFYCARQAMTELGLPIRPDVNMNLFVGPPLGDCFRLTFGLEEQYVDKACDIYRKYYSTVGRFKAEFYPNVIESLGKLKKMGLPMGITTMKGGNLAQLMVDHFGLSEYIFKVVGADLKGRRTKADLVNQATEEFGLADARQRVLLVGDTMLDAEGARIAGTDFLGVSFGFGQFSNEQRAKFRHPLMEDFSELPVFVS